MGVCELDMCGGIDEGSCVEVSAFSVLVFVYFDSEANHFFPKNFEAKKYRVVELFAR